MSRKRKSGHRFDRDCRPAGQRGAFRINATGLRGASGHGICFSPLITRTKPDTRHPADVRLPAGFFISLSTGANRSENVAALASRAAASEDEIKV